MKENNVSKTRILFGSALICRLRSVMEMTNKCYNTYRPRKQETGHLNKSQAILCMLHPTLF